MLKVFQNPFYANKINSSVLLNLGQILQFMGATTFNSTNLLELFNLICLLCKKEIATVNYLPTNEELRKKLPNPKSCVKLSLKSLTSF